jgi:hypothetical protein
MPVDIKLLEKDQIDKVLQFFNNAQSDSVRRISRSRQEFEWLFLEGISKPALYTVATDEVTGGIIGTTAGIFIPMQSPPGDQILTLKSEDSLLSLDQMIKLGKKDLLKEMLNSLEEKAVKNNVSFIWGFTAAGNSFKRNGFQIGCQVKGCFLVNNPVRFYKYRIAQFPDTSLIKKSGLFIFSWYNYFRQLFLSLSFSPFSFRQVSLDEIDEELLLSFLPSNVFTLRLNKQFLNWRVTRNPSSMSYRFLETRNKGNKIIAYLIYSFNKEKIFFVEQFLFREGLQDKVKLKILKSAFRELKKQNPTSFRAMGFTNNSLNINEMTLLKKIGFYFFENRKASFFIFKNLANLDVNVKEVYLSRLNTLGTV